MNDDLAQHLETQEDVEHVRNARTVSGRSLQDRIVSYPNIGAMLEAQTERHGDKVWLIDYSDGEGRSEYSYREFTSLVKRTAKLLTEFGITKGDRICTVGVNHAATVIQYFAAWTIGAVVVPVNVGEDDKRIAYIVENSHAKFAFVQSAYMERIRLLQHDTSSLKHIIEVTVGEEKHDSFQSRISKMNDEFELRDIPSLDDDALIVYTSGTTGVPKGVVLDQYNLLVDAHSIAEWHGMDESQRMMCVLPIHHVNGTVVTLMTPMYFGGSVVLNQKFHTDKFFERIASENVQVVSVVPTLLQYLVHEGIDCSTYDLSGFRHIICGAGPLTCELSQKFESKYGFPIMHGYGLSETTCYSCFLPIDLPVEEHRRWLLDQGFPSIGVAIPCNDMDIHSPEGKSVPEGERGEIVIRGHNVMKYYYKNPQANASTFAFGWFRSGDEGFYRTDDRGRKFFFITGRLKELIIRGAVNLAPLEIDEVINACPGVKAGIAVGFENDWYGEEVGALVIKADESLTEARVIEHCRKTLPFSKSPKIVVFTDALPVTSTGKYQRMKVKHLFEEWKSVQFGK